MPYTILFGELAIIALNQFIKSDNKFLKALMLVAIACVVGIFAIIDGGRLRIFRNLSLFTYLVLGLWLTLENKNKTGIVCYSVISVIIAAVILCFDGVTPILEDSNGNGLTYLLSYGYSMFLPFAAIGENFMYSSFLSLFPVPLVLAMIYVYKKEKHLNFLMPMILLIVLQSVFCMSKLPIFNFIGWNVNSNIAYAASATGLTCIYLYIYMIANIEENMFKMKNAAKIALAFLVFYFLAPRPEAFMGKGYMYVLAMLVTLLYFLFIQFTDKRYKNVLLVVLSLWSIISAVLVLWVQNVKLM